VVALKERLEGNLTCKSVRILTMRIVKLALTFVAALVFLFLGCHHATFAYVLNRDGRDPILLPPGRAGGTSRNLSAMLKEARRSVNRSDCDITNDLVSLSWRGSTARLEFHSQAFLADSDQSPNQIGRGVFVDPLVAMDNFRMGLAKLEMKGCLKANESARIRRGIVESFPMPPVVAYFLQLGSYDVTGYFDLTPDFRVQINSPIYAPGGEQSTRTLAGYETVNYSLVRESPDSLTRFQLSTATDTLIGQEPVETPSPRNELPFSKSPSHFRLFFMTDETSSDRVTRAVVLSATKFSELDGALVYRSNRPDDFCTKVATTGMSCVVLPKNYGVSPELRVRVNRKDAFVTVGGMVQDVLDLESADAPLPLSLEILRPFHDRLIPIKFDRASRDILKLVLLPGDQITY
jgi:hypothetical protein